MKKKLLLIGETARGKDTVCHILQEKYGLVPVCSYTDRPMRPKETNGKEHHFVSQKEASRLLRKKAEHIIAYTKIGNYRYFAFREDFEKADIYIIDPAGVAYLKEKCPDIPMVRVYVTCRDEISKERAALRGDEEKTYEKRRKAETEQFREFREKQNYDVVIFNNGTKEMLQKNVMALMRQKGDLL